MSADGDISRWTHVDSTLAQRIVRGALTRLGRWWLRYEATGYLPRVPDHGGFLLAPGPHGAWNDVLVFTLGQGRVRMRFMAKRELFRPVISSVLRWAGAFPVDRSGGKGGSALAVAEAVVRSGDGVLMFPEGRFYLDRPGLGPARTGVARLALATGAPVVPVAAWGAKRGHAYGLPRFGLRRPKVNVAWGAPLVFAAENDPTRKRLEQVTGEIWDEVERLLQVARARHEARS